MIIKSEIMITTIIFITQFSNIIVRISTHDHVEMMNLMEINHSEKVELTDFMLREKLFKNRSKRRSTTIRHSLHLTKRLKHTFVKYNRRLTTTYIARNYG